MSALKPTHGSRLLTPEQTRFRLWAPDADQVEVRIVDADKHQLTRCAQGWFEADVSVGAGALYRYLINAELEVPDPASRQQLHGPHGPSVVVDHSAYQWTTQNWSGRPWEQVVIYELHVGAIGGFKQVEAWLPRLHKLGITALELMPLNEFPGARNWGYDGVLPFAPQSSYGTPDELKHLIDSAHAQGIMVFVDVVYNHFGPDGNFLAQYAGCFFNDEIPTLWGAGIDFSRQPVRDFFIENALMWVHDYRIDGLRLDAVHAISDQLFLNELSDRLNSSIVDGRHLHLILENEHNDAQLLEEHYTAQWNDDGHNVLHALLTDERDSYYAEFAANTTEKLARFLESGFVFQGENSRHGNARGKPSGHLDANRFVLFLQNHDQIGNRALGERLIHLTGEAQLKAATALLLLCPMVPLLFMGEEWGCTAPFLFFTDHNNELAQAVREGRRHEFREFPAFADEAQRERIPDPNALSSFTRSQPLEPQADNPEQQAWQGYYQRLLALRQHFIVPRLKGARSVGVEVLADKAVCARWRMGDGALLRIDLNLSDQPCALVAVATNAQTVFAVGAGLESLTHQQLPAFSCLVTLDAPL
ncbi:malto-oligosyltrehalose trehalohydrolase [Pseudomonas sp. EL_65y_Pfl2_R95]|uniref:malto-oligosyltrehalose trehalohydrolase n=1 Tax=Pseudomonas sp. EL_65y_Pfl2_R95 TaxID=3088698 RepID=UPI0030D892AC